MLWKVKRRCRENVYLKSLDQCPQGNLMSCQMAQAKAGEGEGERAERGGVKLAGGCRGGCQVILFLPCPAEKAVIILIPDC